MCWRCEQHSVMADKPTQRAAAPCTWSEQLSDVDVHASILCFRFVAVWHLPFASPLRNANYKTEPQSIKMLSFGFNFANNHDTKHNISTSFACCGTQPSQKEKKSKTEKDGVATLGFGHQQSHSSLEAFHDRATVGALGWTWGSSPPSGRDALRSWRLSSTRLVTKSAHVTVCAEGKELGDHSKSVIEGPACKRQLCWDQDWKCLRNIENKASKNFMWHEDAPDHWSQFQKDATGHHFEHWTFLCIQGCKPRWIETETNCHQSSNRLSFDQNFKFSSTLGRVSGESSFNQKELWHIFAAVQNSLFETEERSEESLKLRCKLEQSLEQSVNSAERCKLSALWAMAPSFSCACMQIPKESKSHCSFEFFKAHLQSRQAALEHTFWTTVALR